MRQKKAQTKPVEAVRAPALQRAFRWVVAAVLATTIMVPSCTNLPKDVSWGPAGFSYTGIDGVTITAQGLEDAMNAITQHLFELEKQVPPNEQFLEDWNGKLTEVLDAKSGFTPRPQNSSGPSIAP